MMLLIMFDWLGPSVSMAIKKETCPGTHEREGGASRIVPSVLRFIDHLTGRGRLNFFFNSADCFPGYLYLSWWPPRLVAGAESTASQNHWVVLDVARDNMRSGRCQKFVTPVEASCVGEYSMEELKTIASTGVTQPDSSIILSHFRLLGSH